MMEILDNKLGYTNKILLLLDGNIPRFTSGLTDMLRQMNAIFGENWWDFMMIGVSKVSQSVSYHQISIEVRFIICSGPTIKPQLIRDKLTVTIMGIPRMTARTRPGSSDLH